MLAYNSISMSLFWKTHPYTGDFTKLFFIFKICYLKCPWDGAHQSCFCAAADLCYISKNAVVSIAVFLRKRTKKQPTISWINTQNTHYYTILKFALKTVFISLLIFGKIYLMLIYTNYRLPLSFCFLKMSF